RACGAYAGPGDPALAPAARRHRLPEVLDPRADGRERRPVRLRARRPGDRVDQLPRPWRGRPHRPEPRQVRLHPELSRGTSYETGALRTKLCSRSPSFTTRVVKSRQAQSIVTRMTLLPFLVCG